MLRELVASFDIDTTKAAAATKHLDKGIGVLASKLSGLVETLAGGAILHGIKSFVEGQIEAGSRVNDLSEKLGVGTDALQAFQFAAGLTGVEAEGAAQALGFLNKNMGEALAGGKEQVEAFAKMGVALKDGAGGVRDLDDVLPEVADALAGMGSQQERTTAAMKLFGKSGAALLPLLKDGSAGLKEMRAEFERLGGGMNEDFIKAADAAGDEIDKLKFAFNGWKSQIAFVILPILTKTVKSLQTWVGALRKVTRESDLAKHAWIAMGAAGAIAGAKAAGGFAKLLGVVPKDASFWKVALGLVEILLVVAGVALLYLAFEDLFTFLTGGESIIGDLVKKFLGLEEADLIVKQLKDTWTLLSGLFATDLTQLAPILDMFKDLAKQVIPFAVAGFLDLIRVVAGLVALMAAFVKTLAQVGSFDFEGAGKTITATGKTLFGDKGLLNTSAVGNLAIHAKGVANAAPVFAEPAHTRGRFGGEGAVVSQKNDITVNVEGVRDAQGAGQAAKAGVRDGLGGALSDALGAQNTGG